MATQPLGRTLWSFQGSMSGAGTTSVGPFDIHDVTDLWLAADLTGSSSGTSPTLTVQLDLFDNFGNVYPAALTLTEFTSALGHAQASTGVHSGDLTLPMSCQVTYTLGGTNPAFTHVAITLAGR